jgi:hypothetical protein
MVLPARETASLTRSRRSRFVSTCVLLYVFYLLCVLFFLSAVSLLRLFSPFSPSFLHCCIFLLCLFAQTDHTVSTGLTLYNSLPSYHTQPFFPHGKHVFSLAGWRRQKEHGRFSDKDQQNKKHKEDRNINPRERWPPPHFARGWAWEIIIGGKGVCGTPNHSGFFLLYCFGVFYFRISSSCLHCGWSAFL